MNKLRRWINRDDGKFYQIGNENLHFLEVLGGILMVSGLLLTVLKKKILPDFSNWLIYASFVCALALFWFGNYKKCKTDKN